MVTIVLGTVNIMRKACKQNPSLEYGNYRDINGANGPSTNSPIIEKKLIKEKANCIVPVFIVSKDKHEATIQSWLQVNATRAN